MSAEFEKPATEDQTLVVVLKGQCELSTLSGGRMRTAQRRTGSTALTPGGERRRLRWKSGGLDHSHETGHLYLPQSFILEAADHYRRAGHAARDAPPMLVDFADTALAAIVSAMVQAMHAGAANLYAETSAQWLAVHLLAQNSPWRQHIMDGRHGGDISDGRLARVIDFMQHNLSRSLALDELASEAGISKYHFVRLFKRRTGETPFSYLTRLRLDSACRLLDSTNLPIGHVAAACGYAHVGNFDAAFRHRYGITPRQSRSSAVR